jgi:transposase
LPPALLAEVLRERERLKLIEQQIAAVEAQREAALKDPANPLAQKVLTLMTLKAVGPGSAWLFVEEFFGWRKFRNRRQVGSAAGLTAAPFNSGHGEHDQGISKAGNRRVRTMAVQIAWGWLRYQPDSALSVWFSKKFLSGKRSRRVGIVALARRLLISLWRFVEQGVVPDGAKLSA